MKTRIAYIMKQEAVTQQRFAEMLGIAPGTLSNILSGRTNPTANLVQAVHRVFPSISIQWLMFGEGDMYAGGAEKEAAPQGVVVEETPAPVQTLPLDAVDSIVPQGFRGGSYVGRPPRQVTEVRIFFDDGTYETFSPAKGKEC